MKDDTYSSAQYNEKPSNWQNAPNGPPSGVSDPKVTKLRLVPSDGFKDIREDIIEFTALALKHEAFSFERLQYQRLLAEICKSDASDELRQEAMRSLLTTSDWGFMEDIPDYKKVIMNAVGIEKT
tara:strand:- start:3149 stop:3523 length:375 start_codon:yes stop_codon:yes gene_type:complete